MDSKVTVGQVAERQAAEFLLKIGYTIITRNYRIRGGEIDIIALDGEELVFVEVRWRADDLGEESISAKKVSALHRTIQSYLTEMEENRSWRCDLIAASPRECRHHLNFLSS